MCTSYLFKNGMIVGVSYDGNHIHLSPCVLTTLSKRFVSPPGQTSCKLESLRHSSCRGCGQHAGARMETMRSSWTPCIPHEATQTACMVDLGTNLMCIKKNRLNDHVDCVMVTRLISKHWTYIWFHQSYLSSKLWRIHLCIHQVGSSLELDLPVCILVLASAGTLLKFGFVQFPARKWQVMIPQIGFSLDNHPHLRSTQ